jgi:hypothetical protein
MVSCHCTQSIVKLLFFTFKMRFCVFGTIAIVLIVVTVMPWSDVALECNTAEQRNETFILEAGWAVDYLTDSCTLMTKTATGTMLLIRILYAAGCIASYFFLYRCCLSNDGKSAADMPSTVVVAVIATALCVGSLLSWHLKAAKDNWQGNLSPTGPWIIGVLICITQLSTVGMQIHNLWQLERLPAAISPPQPYQAL